MNKHIAVALALGMTSTFVLAGGNTTSSGGSDKPHDWNQLDANNDGFVTKQEVEALGPVIDFKAADKNGDDRLSKEEFAAISKPGGAAGAAAPAEEKTKKPQ